MAEDVNNNLKLSEKYKDYAVGLRRWFHEHPESSFKEYKTSERIKKELESLGIPYQTVGDTGIVGVIYGNKGSKNVVGLRADIDALEIEEKTDVPYKSENEGIMHACGHDSHITALLTAARVLNDYKNNINGIVKLIFQPAEEIGRGAKTIVDSGLIDDVDAFFGLHVTPEIPTGKVSVVDGPIMAGANSLNIIVNGKSGHGGRPNQGRDAIVAGCAIVQALQNIVAREVNPILPAVVTVGKFHAGTRENIIANKAEISGTVRILTEESRSEVAESVKRIVKSVAEAYRVDAEIDCSFATYININNPSLYEIAKKASSNILSEDAIVRLPQTMGTEDFAVYGTVAPSFYVNVGTAHKDNNYPLHNEHFLIDENVLPIAAALHAEFARLYFDSSK